MLNQQHEQAIIEKLRALPPGRVAEVEDFVDFLHSRHEDRTLTDAACGKQLQSRVGQRE